MAADLLYAGLLAVMFGAGYITRWLQVSDRRKPAE